MQSCRGEGVAAPNPSPSTLPTRLFAGVAAVVLLTTVATGILHDHREYLVQWAAVLDGRWHPTNAYGPLHNAFAGLFALHPLLPKVAFAILALVCGAVLLGRGVGAKPKALPATGAGAWARPDAESGVDGAVRVVLALFLLNPVVVVSTYVYGQNDIVAAFFVLLAVMARSGQRPMSAGVLLGLASLAKLYPLMLVPFLALDGRRNLRLRVVVGAVGTFAAGIGVAVAIWGLDALGPVAFGSSREAKMLSILRFLTCDPALVGGTGAVQTLLDLNTVVVLGTAGLTFGALFWLGASWRPGTVLGLLAVLVAYKVGHPQFYVTWLVLLTWLLVDERSGDGPAVDARERRVGVHVLPVAAFVALYQVLYVAGGVSELVRCWISVPFTAVAIGSLVAGLRGLGGVERGRWGVRW